MKEVFEFDFHAFIEKLKKMNLEHGYKALGDDVSDEDIWRVHGYQDCLDDVINIFKECME